MVQHPTNAAISPPKVLLLICLLDREAYGCLQFNLRQFHRSIYIFSLLREALMSKKYEKMFFTIFIFHCDNKFYWNRTSGYS